MLERRTVKGIMLLAGVIALLLGWHFFSSSSSAGQWKVSDEGVLDYVAVMPQYNLSPPEDDGNSTLSAVLFQSRGANMAALLRIPRSGMSGDEKNGSIPGIVLLPGATVSKEKEQKLARYLSDLGFASITLDQRNLGGIDPKADLQLFLKEEEPTEHKMVYDALAAAELLRSRPEIDPMRIIYAGESNGGRFAIIACALDRSARGVLAISTCGYAVDAAIGSAGAVDNDLVRFYRSIDPETYLGRIAPRPLAMIHSLNDTIIPCKLAEQTFARAVQPKRLHTVGCNVHGYCAQMNDAIEEELDGMAVI
ncbi:MAG: Alpha/beta hydrolase family protein [Methanosaeta sp. PtaU1.Bin112]|nr:MAG: Alpha/beta hydrolase family protein [Methanosaeta sp. PtaU1.Bin112]